MTGGKVEQSTRVDCVVLIRNHPSSFQAGEYQMAQLLHHQDSGFYDKELHGCRWGILQFFGFRRRQRSAKMQPDKKHGPEKNSRGKLSGP
jgi:hypothetical protein